MERLIGVPSPKYVYINIYIFPPLKSWKEVPFLSVLDNHYMHLLLTRNQQYGLSWRLNIARMLTPPPFITLNVKDSTSYKNYYIVRTWCGLPPPWLWTYQCFQCNCMTIITDGVWWQKTWCKDPIVAFWIDRFVAHRMYLKKYLQC